MAVVIDQPVADFEAPATSGQTVSLSALKGQQVVIYFYPKDSTPGCTTEGQGFRDQYAAFKAANTEVFGVSRDSVKSHENFKGKQAFPFELISDKDEAVCQLFDVIKLKAIRQGIPGRGSQHLPDRQPGCTAPGMARRESAGACGCRFGGSAGAEQGLIATASFGLSSPASRLLHLLHNPL